MNIDQIRKIFSERLREVKELVKETNKSSVLVIQQFPLETDSITLIPNIRESISNIIAFVELGDKKVLKEIISLTDGEVDYIVLDVDIKNKNTKELIQFTEANIKISKLLFYSDFNTWADSAIVFLQQISHGINDKSILLAGQGVLANILRRKLNDFDIEFINTDQFNTEVDIIIGAAIKSESMGIDKLHFVSENTKIYDVGIGNFSSEFIEGARNKKASIYRIDIRAGVSSIILNLLETESLIEHVMGSTTIKGIEIVAGGMMGTSGAIIVDDINKPSYIIGVADGKGYIKNQLTEEDELNIEFINRLIKNK
jgi:hypothetical protein